MKNNNLTHLLLDLNIHDGGEYSCEVETDEAEPTAVVHTVEILGESHKVATLTTCVRRW